MIVEKIKNDYFKKNYLQEIKVNDKMFMLNVLSFNEKIIYIGDIMKKFILLIALSVLLYSAPGYAAGNEDPEEEMQKAGIDKAFGRKAPAEAPDPVEETAEEEEAAAVVTPAEAAAAADEEYEQAKKKFEQATVTWIQGLRTRGSLVNCEYKKLCQARANCERKKSKWDEAQLETKPERFQREMKKRDGSKDTETLQEM